MIPTHDLREICRLLLRFKAYSNHKIGTFTKHCHQTVGSIRRKLDKLKINSWEDITKLTDSELKNKLYTKYKQRYSSKALPNFEKYEKQFNFKAKHRKTRKLCFKEYRLEHLGEDTYGYTRFCHLFNKYCKSKNIVMKQAYMAGEIMCIDYAGTTLRYQSKGKDIKLNVFVACMGHSKKLFAIATKDMTIDSWTHGIVSALTYFGGVPEVIQSDNAKAMVSKAGRIPQLNDNATALAQHYNCICDTSRVGTPTDNAVAENAVKIITQKTLVPMNQDLQFFSEKELNAYLLQEIDNINAAPFQRSTESRNDLFAEEAKVLRTLPDLPFKPFVSQHRVIVPSTYHIQHKGHEYSVPHTLAGEEVMVRITHDEFLAYYDGSLVSKHELSNEARGFSRLPEHMTPSHLAQESKTKETFLEWAKEISPDVEAIVEHQYKSTRNPKSRTVGKRCLMLQKLCNESEADDFYQACHYALERECYEPADIALVLKAKAWESDCTPKTTGQQNIRGRDYYAGATL
ncbi:hypothetical protein JL49_19620 [Pseudoalteromonas luteoviolacea]|nr:hypothetical protein JL49_19620 [Pseudoalteromonas luteoviolacea]